MTKDKITVLDLFAGVGGLSYAFHRDPLFDVIAANEILESPARAYVANNPGTKMYVNDIRNFSKLQLEMDFGPDVRVDVILGGPPCQSYSTAGKRSSADPRATLFEEYRRLLVELRPKMFVFENVKGLLSMEGGELFPKILRSFKTAGYETRAQVLNAADYGAPQVRERVILVGTMPGVAFEYPAATHARAEEASELGLIPHVTLGEALGDLPDVGPGENATKYKKKPANEFQERMRRNSLELTDHESPTYGDKLTRIMQLLPEGGSAWDLPKKEQPSSGFGNSYGRLWWNKPSPTVTRNLGTPSSARCIHPYLPRALTTREGARLQCFPDDFKFHGSRIHKNLQIGEAVPVVLSYALLSSVKHAIATPKAGKGNQPANEQGAIQRNGSRKRLRRPAIASH